MPIFIKIQRFYPELSCYLVFKMIIFNNLNIPVSGYNTII